MPVLIICTQVNCKRYKEKNQKNCFKLFLPFGMAHTFKWYHKNKDKKVKEENSNKEILKHASRNYLGRVDFYYLIKKCQAINIQAFKNIERFSVNTQLCLGWNFHFVVLNLRWLTLLFTTVIICSLLQYEKSWYVSKFFISVSLMCD